MSVSTESNLLVRSLRFGLLAARRNLVPALLLQLIALGIVLSYYLYAPSRAVFQSVAEFKQRTGIPFAIVSTAIFGGLLPLLILRLQPATRRANPWRFLPFNMLFWAEKGFEVDILYRLQAHLFGDSHAWTSVIPKVLVDQFLYVPIFCVPSVVLGFLWRDTGFSFARTRDALGRHWLRERFIPVMVSNCAVWLPAVTLIYCLPLAVQLPVENIILTIWALLLSVLTRPGEQE